MTLLARVLFWLLLAPILFSGLLRVGSVPFVLVLRLFWEPEAEPLWAQIVSGGLVVAASVGAAAVTWWAWRRFDAGLVAMFPPASGQGAAAASSAPPAV